MNKEYVLFLYLLTYYDIVLHSYENAEDVIEVCVKGNDLDSNEFCAKAYTIASSELAKEYPTMACLNSLKLLQRYGKKKFRTENKNER